MAIKYKCYNSWNAFSSFILRLYKVMYVVFVSRLGKYIKRSICAFLQPMAKFLCNYIQFILHVESFKIYMINLACGVIRISIKCSCLEIFDQQGNPNLTLLVVDFLILSFGVRASGSRSDICFLCISSQFDFYLFLSF